MASDKITIDRELFDDLVECAIDCEANTRWRRDDPRQCRQWDKRIPDIMARAVAIRDAPQHTPQRIAGHPMQPVAIDKHGTARFVRNAIVEHMVDSYPGGLNELACKGFGDEDWTQLAQLIGYSVGGFGELSYVSDEAYQTAVDAESELRKTDRQPRSMTDAEREIWTEAGLFEVQLQAAAQRLREALGNPDIGSLDVVEAVDELIAKHAKSIAAIRDAQRKIIEWMTRTDSHTDLQLWRGVGDVPVVTVGISEYNRPENRTTDIDPSRCLLIQIAEAIDEWKRINLPAGGKSE